MAQVDPRACGVNFRGFYAIGGADGRSPRMRGKHLVYGLSRDANGSIPAHAG